MICNERHKRFTKFNILIWVDYLYPGTVNKVFKKICSARAKYILTKSVEFTSKFTLNDEPIPINEIQEYLTKAYNEIKGAKHFGKKYRLMIEVKEQFFKFFKKYGFTEDAWHEIRNPLDGVFSWADNIILSIRMRKSSNRNLPNYECDNLCKCSFDAIVNTLKRYKFFIDRGLDKNNIEPEKVFQLALDSIAEKSKFKNIKTEITDSEILKNYKEGLFFDAAKTRRFADYELYTVFSNLIQNAAKYSPENSTVEIKFTKHKIDNQNYVGFLVRDKGIGIPKEEQEKSLKGFRASNAIKSGIEGTGYGLRRVDKLLENFDSFLTIKSPVNKANKKFPGTEISCLIKSEN